MQERGTVLDLALKTDTMQERGTVLDLALKTDTRFVNLGIS